MKKNESLRRYTTLQVGGPADYFLEVHTEDELIEAINFALEHQLSFKVLGGGSNVLVPEQGVGGLVIHNRILGITYEDEGAGLVRVVVGAGVELDALVSETVSKGLWGLENLSHIPGTVGATPVQNVGAYGVEVKDLIKSVRVYDATRKEFKDMTAEECEFGYRDSIFKHENGKHLIVCAVTFELSSVAKPQLSYKDLSARFADSVPSLVDIREAVILIRSEKFPDWTQVGTAGSFFKNPIITQEKFETLKQAFPELPGFVNEDGNVKVPLGWILDKVLNLKGVTEGEVGTYKGQALVLINQGKATAGEIESFANKVIAEVKEVTGIEVEWEVTKW